MHNLGERMSGYRYTEAEIGLIRTNACFADYHAAFPHRTIHGWRQKRAELGITGPPGKPTPAPAAPFVSDKVDGVFSWRDANRVIATVQEFRHATSQSQDAASIVFDVDHPIAFVCLSDTHIGNIGADHDALERLTDEILSTPNLYVALLGDVQDMAIRLRGVLEVTSNVLTPDQQHRYVESWLEEIAPRVLFSTWDNHSVMREENQAGSSRYADLMRRRVIWHSGIGHPDITVGGETYKLAVSHVFRGRSIDNPCHGAMRYLRREGIDREIAIAGDSHVPGIIRYVDGHKQRMAVNSGSLQAESGYAKRFFSLSTHPVFPVVELWPDRHRFAAYWTLDEWRDSAMGPKLVK